MRSWIPLLSAAPALGLVAKYDGPTDNSEGDTVRLITAAALDGLKRRGPPRKFEHPFFPRANEPDLEASSRSPLVLWVGNSQRTHGGFYTFGDLVALYGDLRRIITCDDANRESCSLADTDDDFTVERRVALRDIAHGWLFWGDRAGNPSLARKAAIAALGTDPHTVDNPTLDQAAKNTADAWAHELVHMAMTNDWHFSDTALAWYAAMHLEALYFMQVGGVAGLRRASCEPLRVWQRAGGGH